MSEHQSASRKIRVKGPSFSSPQLHKSTAMGGKILTKPFLLVAIIAAIGFFFIAKRFLLGLGSVSNLNHGYPWGMWISFDVVAGTAIGSGGYAMALLVYVLNKGKYSAMVRPAILTAFLGYLMAGLGIVIDTGRYWNLYNMFRWPTSNIDSSVMVEVAISVASYTLILFLEYSPAILEKFKKYKLREVLNMIIFIFIAFGVLLPTLHQSSLGTMMIPMGEKLSPLWQTQLLPLLYLLSALFIGYGAVIFEAYGSALVFERRVERRRLADLSGIIPYLIAVFLVVRFGDLIYRGAFSVFNNSTLQSSTFIVENLLFLVPMVVLFSKELRARRQIQFLMALTVLGGGVLYRFNSYLIGFDPGFGWHYFPAFSEIMISLGLVAFEVMLYLIIIKKFPILPIVEHTKSA